MHCARPNRDVNARCLPKEGQDAKRAEPIGRFGRVDEVAHTVALLASDAGSYYVGVTMNMNGGDYMI
jgi:3-oxoacyl-[acyl-carrier protein] reductase